MGAGGQHHAQPALRPKKKDPVLTGQESGWAPGPVWKGAENHTPPVEYDPQDRPARRESLYQLHYPGPHTLYSKRIRLNV